jgi:XRE family transcriptional regulator, regulator of sulfur utilization
MSINEVVGTQVRHLRKTQGMTQEELAEKSGLSVDYIGKIERGTTSPTVESMEQVARGLGVRIANLFDLWEEDSQSQDSVSDLVRISRYLQNKSPDDVEFALSIIRQILDR